jgi:carbon storage regulator
MLVLTRRVNEDIIINGTIRIRVLDARHDRVRIGVAAPPAVRVDRQEVAERRLAAAGTEAPEPIPHLRETAHPTRPR